ncbi:MAG: cytochrome-c oxidase, cbb3-type subunit III [Alphaproteobacteria bacterium]|nr:cytochrome-c oxidase, cbb3-type subunit III [Alphaproteobacteria bacterium]
MTDDHNKTEKKIDAVSGVQTTGHSWDNGSLEELNNPAPRWWVIVWLITIVWAIGYWVVYPAWPTLSGNTKGTAGWTEYKKLAEDQAEITARQNVYLGRFEGASFDQIMNDPELYAFAVAGGRAAFKDNCATCHGSGAEGGKGYPNLNDDDWLWGGDIETIYQTLKYGIRSEHEDTRISQMPSFGKDGLLQPEEINQVIAFVQSLSQGHEGAHAEEIDAGAQVFADNCAACHGDNGKGMREVGAPNLSDNIWLYGGDHDSIYESVFNAHAGVMPAWVGRLDNNTIRELAVYVHSLGGGEATPAAEGDDQPMEEAAPVEEMPAQETVKEPENDGETSGNNEPEQEQPAE